MNFDLIIDVTFVSENERKKNERKKRVREIVSIAFGSETPGLDDDDIIDALGIALWFYKTGGRDGAGTI